MKNNLFRFGVMFLASLISYAYVLDNGFLGDDVIRIQENPEFSSLWTALTGELGDRPLLILSVWLDYVLGLNAPLMRIVNIFFHAITAWQLSLFIQERTEEKKNSNFALGIGLLFALHPLHSQSINIVIQRGVILASLFGLLSIRHFILYVVDEKKSSFWKSVLTLFLAILCKPIVSFLPFFFLLASLRLKKGGRYLIFYFLPLAVPMVFYSILGKNSQATLSETVLNYFLIQMEVIFTYFRLMMVPLGMRYLYDFQPSSLNWLYLAAHVLLFGLGLKLIRNTLLSILFCGFYLSFLPESSFFPIIHTAFDHRTYFPLVFLFSFIGIWGIQSRHENLIMKSFPVIALIYLGLNQVRNFQIKPVDRWMIHTLENSLSHHSFNFVFNAKLMKKGNFKEVAKNLKRYNLAYPGIVQYEILQKMYDIKTHPENASYVDELAELVKLGFDGEAPRNSANSILIAKLGYPGASIEKELKLEDILSMQMRSFFAPGETRFSASAMYYQSLVDSLLSRKDLKRYTSNINILKMKAILTHYFKRTFPGLKDEIQLALNEDKNSSVLLRLNLLVD